MLRTDDHGVDNLSQAQFDMIRRGSDAAVNQTRPILGTVKKIAEGLGYQLNSDREERVQRDLNGNLIRRGVSESHGFTSREKETDALGNVTHRSRTVNSLPGYFGGRRKTRNSMGMSHEQEVAERMVRRPGSGGSPPSTTTPPPAGPRPQGPAAPPARPMPFRPTPRGPRPNGNLDRQFWPPTPPATPRPVQDISAWNQPFNGTQGRSDYGDPRA